MTNAQLETNMEELRAAFGSQEVRETPASDSIESRIFGILDRLVDHGHCVADVVLAPAKADGEPDWENAGPANVSSLPADEFPADEQSAKRACVIIDHVDGCSEDSSFLIRLDGQTAEIFQIHGPSADFPVAESIVGRDIAATPKPREPGKLAQSMAKLTADLAAKKAPPVAANDNEPGDQKAGKFTITRFRDLGKAKPKPAVIKGVRYASEASYTVAKPGGGKSATETDIGYHIATGRDWHGRKVAKGLVVYFAAERKKLQDRRVMAYREHYGDDYDVPMVVIGGKPDLTDQARRDATDMVSIIKALEREYGLPCVLITIDTLARTFGGKNQNATEDMSRFVFNIDLLMDRVPTAHVSIIHHEGWETGRAKGSIDLDGAVDASFRITRNGDVFKLVCDGANDGEEGDILTYGLKSVQIGVDDDGEPVSAPVLVKMADAAALGAAGSEKAKTKQAQSEAEAMDILAELSAGGHPVGGGLWLAKFRETDPDAKEETVKSRWQRAVRALEDAGCIVSSGMPKVYALAEVQEQGAREVHAPEDDAPAPSDPSERQGAKVQVQTPFRGCTDAPAPAEGEFEYEPQRRTA